MLSSVYTTTFDPADSYGRLSRELSAGLLRAGMQHVNRVPLDGSEGPSPRVFLPSAGGFLLGYPTLHPKFPALAQVGPRIALTMFEPTRIPDEWVAHLNRVDAVSVPSQFIKTAMARQGVMVPIHVIPLGVSEAFFRVRERPAREPFTFLIFGDRGSRKRPDKAMFAFYRAFGDSPHYRLIVKSRQIGQIRNGNIEVVQGDLSDEELAELYGQCHVMIFPTHGEGFGLPPREFAATGGVSLATNWGGTADEIEHWGIPITDYEMIDAWERRPEWHGTLGQWSDVSVDGLAALLRDVAAKYEAYRARLAGAPEYCRTHYNWQRFADTHFAIWERITEDTHASTGRI